MDWLLKARLKALGNDRHLLYFDTVHLDLHQPPAFECVAEKEKKK